MKSEPQVYSIEDLKRENTTIWDGVRNYQARNFLKQMQAGDLAFFLSLKLQTTGDCWLNENYRN
jgi:predicted RNA-binding protein with PUA-like domain